MRLWWKSREQNADLLAYEGEFVTLQVDRPLRLGEPVTVEAHLPDEPGHLEMTVVPTHEVQADAGLRAFIDSLHYAPRRHIYCARLEEPAASEPYLRILLERLPVGSGHHHRLAPRLPHQITVMSPDLPGFRATTLDISLTGLSFKTEAALDPGRRISVEVVFDSAGYPPLQAVARICWCRPVHPGARHDGYVVGAHFECLSRTQERELQDFVEAALHPEPFPLEAP